MCHLSVILTFCPSGRKGTMASSVCKDINFYSALKEALKYLSEFNMSRALKSEQKEAISALVPERIYWPCCQLALGKAWYIRC